MADDETTPGPSDDWSEEVPTRLDGVVVAPIEDVTKPHDITPLLAEARQAGCEQCYEEGQADALIALRSLLYEKGAPEDEVVAVVEAVRARLVRL